MALVLLKLTLTPILIGAASVAARRWGPLVGGWLVALPLTSAPVAFYLALEHGTAFASATAEGSLAGLAATAAFGVTYARVARLARVRSGWRVAWVAASFAFVLVAAVAQRIAAIPVWLLLAAIEAWLGATYVALPAAPAGAAVSAARPDWEIPARMAVGTILVLAITAVAAAVGPALTGVVSTFPVYVSVLAVFAHHLEGPAPAIAVIRGTAAGLFGTAIFLAILASGLVPLGIAVAFAAAAVASAAAQAAILLALRHDRMRGAESSRAVNG